jgi:parallel beta-helix repeat protein
MLPWAGALAAASDTAPPAAPATHAPEVLTADTAWKGQVLLRGEVVVPAGVTLRVEPGTSVRLGPAGGLRIQGTLLAEGRGDAPVTFEPDPALPYPEEGTAVMVSGRGSARFSHCRLGKLGKAIFVSESDLELVDTFLEDSPRAVSATISSRVTVRRSSFIRTAEGIDATLQTMVRIHDSTFQDCGSWAVRLLTSAGGGEIAGNTFRNCREGVILKQAKEVRLAHNTFADCTLGMALDQVGPDVRVEDSSFRGAGMGLRLLDTSTPSVSCSRFIGLETGILVERFSTPRIAHNLFQGNQTGLAAVQKCNLPVQRNIFRDNRRGIFLDYSSYARIHENDFTGNARDVALGSAMSADYENRVGTGGIIMENAARSKMGRLTAASAGWVLSDGVDATGNWWGEETTRAMEAGKTRINLPSLEDGFDTPSVTYPGWAEGTFAVDKVNYLPWAASPIPGAGPSPGSCGERTTPAPSRGEAAPVTPAPPPP